MRHLIAFILCCLATTAASAQPALTLLGVGAPTVAAGYSGPGDVVAGATFYVSCTRAWTAAYASAHSNACDLVRASDSTSCTMVFLTNGNADVATTSSCTGATQTVTAFCNATTCKVSKAYDQTGNAHDFTQGTDASRPTFDPAGAKVMVFAGSQELDNTTIGGIVQVFSVSAVAKRTSGTSTSCIICMQAANDDLAYHGANLATIIWNNAFVDEAATDGSCHDLSATGNGASSVFMIDGSSNTVNPGTGNLNNNYDIGAYGGSFGLTGTVREVMVYASDKSASFSALTTNQSGYGGC